MSQFWKEFSHQLTLTTDDKSALRDMMSSAGWRVMTHKVFPKEEVQILAQNQTAKAQMKESAFSAGIYAGLQLAQALPGKVSSNKPDQPRSQHEKVQTLQTKRHSGRGSGPL